MLEIAHFVWLLLPLALLLHAIKGTFRAVSKTGKRDYPGQSFSQALYCGIFWGLAVLLDKLFLAEFLQTVPLSEDSPIIIRWLLYPIILVIAALIQQRFKDKEDDKKRQEMRERQMRFFNTKR